MSGPADDALSPLLLPQPDRPASDRLKTAMPTTPMRILLALSFIWRTFLCSPGTCNAEMPLTFSIRAAGRLPSPAFGRDDRGGWSEMWDANPFADRIGERPAKTIRLAER